MLESGFREKPIYLDYCFFNSGCIQKRLSVSLCRLYFKIIWLSLFVSLTVDDAHAENLITWPQFDIPPLCMIQEDGSFQGVGPSVVKYIQYKMPEYEHNDVIASPVKIAREIKDGSSWIATGILKTADRERFLIYSKYPCRLSWSMMGVIRKKDLSEMVHDGKFDPEVLLNTGQYKLGYVKGINYGSLNSIVNRFKVDETTSYPSRDFRNQISLLVRGRIDLFFADPLIVYYTSENELVEKNVVLLDCKKNPSVPMLGYFAAPRNEWGAKIIDRIDKILEASIKSGEFKHLLMPWVPSKLKKRFNRDYRDYFENPVLKAGAAH